MVSFCEDGADGAVVLHVTNFEKTLAPVPVYEVRELTTAYASASACEQAAGGFSPSHDVFGAVCAGAGEAFHVYLFGPARVM